MRNALHRFDCHFTIRRQRDYLPAIVKGYRFTSKQAPFAVIGDFNGDGSTDVIVQGHNRQADLTLCIMRHNRGYRVVRVQTGTLTDPKKEWYDVGTNEREYGMWIYLTVVSEHTIKSEFEPRLLRLTTDAIELVYWEKASVIYYYRRGSFHQYQTGD